MLNDVLIEIDGPTHYYGLTNMEMARSSLKKILFNEVGL
jgi:hypothetical protein